MKVGRWRNTSLVSAGIAITAMLLSFLWHVPYLYTLIGAAAWMFFGHVITADDDVPGGWGNPDGSLPFPWRELLLKAALLAALLVIAVLFPRLRVLGGG